MYRVDLAKLVLSEEDAATLEVSKAAREDWRVGYARMPRGSNPNNAFYWAALTAAVEKAEKSDQGHLKRLRRVTRVTFVGRRRLRWIRTMDTHNDGIHGGEGSGEFLCFVALLPLVPSHVC
jgi:hypothetical protein